MINTHYIKIATKGGLIVVAWLLLSLPIIFYVLNRSASNEKKAVGVGCTNYTKSVCRDVLNNTGENFIVISGTVDQEANENTAQLITSGLSLLGASHKCVTSTRPFMCLYLFPPCDTNRTVSRQQCVAITIACKDDWQKALRNPAVTKLIPNCESLYFTTETEPVLILDNPNSKTAADVWVQLNCSDQFVESNGTCKPLCDKIKLYSNAISDLDFTVTVISAFAAFISAALLMISFYIWRKKMFVLPSIIILYIAIIGQIFSSFVLVSSLGNRQKLFCSSLYLTKALEAPTGFCSFMGSLYVYSFTQLGVFWLCYVVILFMKTQFPLYSRGLEKRLSVHALVVLLGMLLPCIPVTTAFLTGGYSTAIYPQVTCIIKNPDAAFYSFALLMVIIFGLGVPLLIISFLTAIKHNLKKRLNASNAVTLPSPVEMKILFLLCYFVILASVVVAGTTITAQNADRLYAALESYFACESTGTNPKCDDIRKEVESYGAAEIRITAHALVGAFPGAHLFYVVKVGEIKLYCLSFLKNRKGRSTSPPHFGNSDTLEFK